MKLYNFQNEYLEGLPPKYIFSAQTGTGKSFMALAHYDKHAYPKRLLIVGPAAKMRTGDWERHIEEYFEGRELPKVDYYSYEKFSRNPTTREFHKTGTRGVWQAFLQLTQSEDIAVIADEAHRLANPQSGIGKAMFAISSQTDFFIGLTATPLSNGWISAANYFKIFGFSRNITEFRKRYCRIQDFKGFPEIIGYNREDELKTLWNKISKPLEKEDAIDLPEITEVPVHFKAEVGYRRVQKERLMDGKFLDNPSALLHALRQSTMENKLPWLDEFLEGVSSNIVIFYTYIGEREAILSLIKKKHKERQVFRQDGDKHELPHQSTWEDLERTITLAQYQSGSTGVEMQYADTIIFFSPTYSYTLYHQAVGRIERIGQKNKMTLYKLSCPSTIEYSVWKAIESKADFSEKMWIEDNIEKVKQT